MGHEAAPVSTANSGSGACGMDGNFELFVLAPTIEVARVIAGGDMGIARRTGIELTAGSGAGGEALLRLFGNPSANASACYLVQEGLWMCGAYASPVNMMTGAHCPYPM